MKGAVKEGCGLLLDDFDDLSVETLSVLSVVIQQLQVALQTNQQKFQFEGTNTDIHSYFKILVTSKTVSPSQIVLNQFRVVQILKPDYKMIVLQIMKTIGIINAETLAVKVENMFEQFDMVSNFRKCKQFLLLFTVYWPRFINKFSKTEKAYEYLTGEVPAKQVKDQQAFCNYYEQFVASYCFITIMQGQYETEQLQLFNDILRKVFDKSIADSLIMKIQQTTKQYEKLTLKSMNPETDKFNRKNSNFSDI